MSEPSPDTPEPLPTGPAWSGRGLRLSARAAAELAQRAAGRGHQLLNKIR